MGHKRCGGLGIVVDGLGIVAVGLWIVVGGIGDSMAGFEASDSVKNDTLIGFFSKTLTLENVMLRKFSYALIFLLRFGSGM